MINAARLTELRKRKCGDCWHDTLQHDLQNGHCLDPLCPCPRPRVASQDNLAKRAGLTRQGLSRLEGHLGPNEQNRGVNPAYRTVQALAKALGVDVDELVITEAMPGTGLGN